MLLRSTTTSDHQHMLRDRVRHATEIIAAVLKKQGSSKAVGRAKIEDEIRGYLRSPNEAATLQLRGYGLFPPRPEEVQAVVVSDSLLLAVTPTQKKLVKRLEQKLRAVSDVLADKRWPPPWWQSSNLPPELDDLKVAVAHWIKTVGTIAMAKIPKTNMPKPTFDAHAKRHAAEVAVRLFRHHGLKPTLSHSPNNGLNRLAAAIHGSDCKRLMQDSFSTAARQYWRASAHRRRQGGGRDQCEHRPEQHRY
jgi:hypothetical protein